MSAKPRSAALAAAYRDHVLASVGATVGGAPLASDAIHPAQRWAQSGLMALTGQPSAAPMMSPAPIATLADGALAALATLAPHADLAMLDGAGLLAERAAIAGLQRNGGISAGGACRLLDTADGAFALSLVRDDDWSLLPAWLEGDAHSWDDVQAIARVRRSDELLLRGRELGLALASSRADPHAQIEWLQLFCGRPWHESAQPVRDVPRVIDLSALWAGPLCTHLLQRCGAEVIKVESSARPDGARRGPPAFFDLLNAGKRSVVLDLQSLRGREQLRELLRAADIVIEASRPRALRQMGIDAEALLREHPQLTWLALNGYGRGEPQEQWIAYGDDAGVAGGLSELQRRASGEALFVGDAIADPLTGLHAAVAAWASHRSGGGRLLSIALSAVVRQVASFEVPDDDVALRERHRQWTACVASSDIAAPRSRVVTAAARAFGADTDAVLRDWGVRC